MHPWRVELNRGKIALDEISCEKQKYISSVFSVLLAPSAVQLLSVLVQVPPPWSRSVCNCKVIVKKAKKSSGLCCVCPIGGSERQDIPCLFVGASEREGACAPYGVHLVEIFP